MKTIETVANLVKKAEKNGVALVRRRQRDYWGVGDLLEVYRVENNGETVSLYHYETLTAKVDLKSKKLLYVYGESRSDADSVSTFLDATNCFKRGEFGYKPVNGGFYLYTPEKSYFLEADGQETVVKAFNELNEIRIAGLC